MWAAAATTIALWLVMAPAGAVQVIDLATARRATADAATISIEAQLTRAAQSGAVDVLAAQLQSLATDRRMDPAALEWLLDRGLHELTLLSPTPQAQALVESLKPRAPQVFVRADPDHGGFPVPLYDLGATARFVQNSWRRAAAYEETRAALRAGQTSAIERFARGIDTPERDPVRAGIVDAYLTAPPSLLAHQRDAVITAISQGARVDELALAMAERLADRELLDPVIGHADAPIALAAPPIASRRFDPALALNSLIAASHRPDIASAAVLEIGRLADNDSTARGYLYQAIEDPLAGCLCRRSAQLAPGSGGCTRTRTTVAPGQDGVVPAAAGAGTEARWCGGRPR